MQNIFSKKNLKIFRQTIAQCAEGSLLCIVACDEAGHGQDKRQ